MVLDKAIKYNSSILHSWIKSFKSETLHYWIFTVRFLEASGEPQVQHVPEGSVKLLAGSSVHLCAIGAAPRAFQTSSIKDLSLLLSSCFCLKAEQEWEAESDPGNICSLVCTCIFGDWRLTSLDQLTPAWACSPQIPWLQQINACHWPPAIISLVF